MRNLMFAILGIFLITGFSLAQMPDKEHVIPLTESYPFLLERIDNANQTTQIVENTYSVDNLQMINYSINKTYPVVKSRNVNVSVLHIDPGRNDSNFRTTIYNVNNQHKVVPYQYNTENKFMPNRNYDKTD